MKIAVLAWSARGAGPAWRHDGPVLPIEFAKTSATVGLIPILCNEAWVWNVPTLWAIASLADLNRARAELAAQEGIVEGEIGSARWRADAAPTIQMNALPAGAQRDRVCQWIAHWLTAHHAADGVEAAIWVDSSATLDGMNNLAQAMAAVDQHLNGLQGPAAEAAASSVQQTPLQVWTAIRAHLAVERGWVAGPAAPLPITTADDLRFKDWQECRTTIGRLDTILQTLRQYGFTLITGLLTASGFLGQSNSTAASAVVIAIMVLVAALFSVDTYYQVLLSAAAERALDLEVQTNPPIRVTKYLSINATDSKSGYVTLGLYLALLAAAGGVGLWATGGLTPGPASPGIVPLSRVAAPARTGGNTSGLALSGVEAWVIAVTVVGVIAILAVRWLTRGEKWATSGWRPWVIAGTVGVWVTLSLAALPLVLEGVTPPAPTQRLIVVIGAALAVYIELYWGYAAIRSGLHRQRLSRIWPEGPEKAMAP